MPPSRSPPGRWTRLFWEVHQFNGANRISVTPTEDTLRIAGGLNDHKAVQCEIPLESILRKMSS